MDTNGQSKFAKQKRYFKTPAGIQKTREASRKYYAANRDNILAKRASKKLQAKAESPSEEAA